MKNKSIEIFCGTGGVGKTTLATSRALNLAVQGKKILLITIDPAKRLKQILNLDDETNGLVHKINCQIFSPPNSQGINDLSNVTFDAILLSPGEALKRIQQHVGIIDSNDNIILKTLSRPTGGLNEIMALVEVHHYINLKKYDTIVLDTPPGKHFIDFLHSAHKIQKFFDKSFVEIFKYLGKSLQNNGQSSSGIINMIISSGIKKLLYYLEKVTGPDFVNEFTNAILLLHQTQKSFLEALEVESLLRQQSFSNWYLVTSAQQAKIEEATTFFKKAQELMHNDSFILVNKTLMPHLESWKIDSEHPLNKLKNFYIEREKYLIVHAQNSFSHVLNFPDVLGNTPQQHVFELSHRWP